MLQRIDFNINRLHIGVYHQQQIQIHRYRYTDTEPKDTQLQKEILCLVSGKVYVVACARFVL